MNFKNRNAGTFGPIMAATLSVFLFFPPSTNAQSPSLSPEFSLLLDSAYDLLYSDFYASDALLNRAEELLIVAGESAHAQAAIDLNHQRAMACIYNNKFSRTRTYLRRSFAALEKYRNKIGTQADSLWYATLFLEALYQSDLGKYDSALQRLGSIEKYYRGKPKTARNCTELYRILQYQASIYSKKGEYESAINGYLASIQYYDCYRSDDRCPNYSLTYRNAGNAFLEKGEVENALIHFWRAKENLDTCMNLDPDPILRTHALALYQSLAALYLKTRGFDSSEFYLHKALPLLNDNPTLAYRIFNGLAFIELEKSNYPKALELFNKTLDVVRGYYGEKHALTAGIHADISELYARNGDFNTAVIFIQKAINSLSPREQVELAASDNPSLTTVFSNKEMVNVLHQKAYLLWRYWRREKQTALLAYGREASRLSLQLLDSMRNDFTLEKDKVILGEEAVRMYETAINISAELYSQSNDDFYLHECFELMDRCKGSVLLDHLKLVRSFSGVPPDILETERQLKAELAIAEEQLFKAESQGKDASRERESLGYLKKDYAQLFSKIKTYYPAYYKLRIENKSVSLDEVQTSLIAPGQAVIEYFVGDTSVFIMNVTKGNANLYSVSYPTIKNEVVKLKNLISKPNASSRNIEQQSVTVYRKLVSPWIAHLDTAVTSVIVIPHGVLSYLPFEMLSDGKNMLLDRFRISYASSASLLAEQKQMTVAGSSFAGFNAEYSGHDIYQPLIGSENELNSIRETFEGNSTVFFNSTADQFRQHAPDFKVLHLALHSFINDEKPLFSKLVFSTDASGNTTEITANELYAMQLNAELAVLSACESGIGKLHRGEGMMSLSRAFMYAGVPSTVISLWKVPDHATARLMEKFYTHLKEGQRKDEALANAKREFIAEYPEMSSPYFWAGFIVNGKSDPLTFSVLESVQWSRLSIIVLFVATMLTAIVQWRRHRTKEISVQTFVNHR